MRFCERGISSRLHRREKELENLEIQKTRCLIFHGRTHAKAIDVVACM